MHVNDRPLRDHLINVLDGRGAHIPVLEALRKFPPALRDATVPGSINSPWRLLEHMRVAQWDILEFSRNPEHESPDFPEGYWPGEDARSDEESWEKSLGGFRRDLEDMKDLVRDPTVDLLASIPHGTGQTVLREALLVADHNAYHLGQIMLIGKARP